MTRHSNVNVLNNKHNKYLNYCYYCIIYCVLRNYKQSVKVKGVLCL